MVVSIVDAGMSKAAGITRVARSLTIAAVPSIQRRTRCECQPSASITVHLGATDHFVPQISYAAKQRGIEANMSQVFLGQQ